MGAQKGVVGDRPRLSKGVEFIEPLSRDVELEQTVLLHAGQGHNLLPLSHSLLTAFPGAGEGELRVGNAFPGVLSPGRG